jgi:hypothetical protein
MNKSYKHFTLLFILWLLSASSTAQQYVGLNMADYVGIQQMPTNPAWVNKAHNGTEVMLFGGSGFAGTNAFTFKKRPTGKELR